MNIQKIVTWTIVVLLAALLGVGVFTLWLIRSGGTQAPPQQQTEIPSQTSAGNTTVSSTSNNPASSSSSADVAKQYAALFASLNAQPISFTEVDGAQGSYGDIYKLYADDIALSKKIAPNAPHYALEVGSIDLEGDGTAEVIVYENLPGMCGSGGCPIDLYKKHSTLYESMFSVLGNGTVGILSTKTQGYFDLLLSTHGDTGFKTDVAEYKWDGSTYAKGSVVATWDGANFVPPAP